MYKKKIGLVLCVAFFSFLVACATSHYTRGHSEMRKGNLDAAIEFLNLALEKNPGDPKIVRDIGITHYKRPDIDLSVKILSQAFEIDSTDGITLFYLGTGHEMLGNYQEAIDKYRRYSQVSRISHIRKPIERRLQWIIRKQIEKEVKDVLAKETSLDVASIPDNTVAVVNFKNAGELRDLDPLQKGLADMLITDLSKAKKLNVVERVKLQKLLQELGLGMSGLVDSDTAPRVGKLLGVAEVVNGMFINLAGEKLRIDGNITEIKTGKFALTDHVAGTMNDLFRLEKELVFKNVDKMGIQLSQEERDDIKKIPTENLLAFMAYCKGLDYEDRGMYVQAKEQYKQAVSIDPNFSQAKENIEKTDAIATAPADISQLEKDFMVEVEAAPEAPILSSTQQITTKSSTIDRLMSSGAHIGAGFVPGVESRKPAEESSGGTALGSAIIKVKVPLPKDP